MIKLFLSKIKRFRRPIFFISILPVISITTALYADLVVFNNLDVPLIGEEFPISPLAGRLFLNPQIQGISSPSAQLLEDNINQATEEYEEKEISSQPLPTPTAAPEKSSEPKVQTVTTSTSRINFPNNKFGIHIFSGGDDIDLASQLINSNGGDWGWVTVTIDLRERNAEKWNSLFAKMLEKHLIPILQLSNNGNIPTEDEIEGIGGFLSGLGWPTKIRPITVFSEVNASEYWGGKIDPAGYAVILNKVIESFKTKSQEFFIMNGAFNASARTGSSEIGCIKTDLGVDTCYLSEIEYLKQMESAVPGILKKLDGWSVHTYPHPAYKGKPSDTRVGAESSFEAGRNTIRSYQFEIRLLSTFGVSLPIFITETGWPHKEGTSEHPEWYDKETVSEYYRQAFRDIFLPDGRIVAVTPFILRFDSYDNFAFIGKTGDKFPQWDVLLSFPKTSGNPPVNK